MLLSQFTFVDLAGSEKIDGENDFNRITEAKYINKSLSALGNVIQALKNKQENTSPSKQSKMASASPTKSTVDYSDTSTMLSAKTQKTLKSQKKSQGGSKQHIPYRDTKLTHILKTCLNNGNSQTHIIICLNPYQSSRQECISSMKFA